MEHKEHNPFKQVIIRGTLMMLCVVSLILTYFALKDFEYSSTSEFEKSVQMHTEFEGMVSCQAGAVHLNGTLPYTFKKKGFEYEVAIVIDTTLSAPLCAENIFPSVARVSAELKAYESDFVEAVNTLVLYPDQLTALTKENHALAKDLALKVSNNNPSQATNEAIAYLQKAQKERERQEAYEVYTPNILLGF